MKKIELYYPTKPFIVTQGFGIKNDAYKRFGFTHHNGVDFIADKDKTVKAMCDGVVTRTGYQPNGAGIFLYYQTDLVEIEGEECYLELIYMHAKELLVKVGDKVKLGQDLIITGNTGFSTGEHTHISAKRIGKGGEILDKDTATNETYNFTKLFNGEYADDIEPKYFDRDISYMDTGVRVIKLQNFLKERGYFDHESTGYFGEVTRAALYAFQTDWVLIPVWKYPWDYLVGKGRVCGVKTRKVINSLIK